MDHHVPPRGVSSITVGTTPGSPATARSVARLRNWHRWERGPCQQLQDRPSGPRFGHGSGRNPLPRSRFTERRAGLTAPRWGYPDGKGLASAAQLAYLQGEPTRLPSPAGVTFSLLNPDIQLRFLAWRPCRKPASFSDASTCDPCDNGGFGQRSEVVRSGLWQLMAWCPALRSITRARNSAKLDCRLTGGSGRRFTRAGPLRKSPE